MNIEINHILNNFQSETKHLKTNFSASIAHSLKWNQSIVVTLSRQLTDYKLNHRKRCVFLIIKGDGRWSVDKNLTKKMKQEISFVLLSNIKCF